MDIQSLWIMRKGELDPELLQAWDEYSVEQNFQGFQEACESAIKAVGNEVEAVRYITLNIHPGALAEAFQTLVVDVDVLDYREQIGGGSK